MRHVERHRTHRIGWLRAAVLGANDGIVSTASLVLGVAAAGASSQTILVAGVAGLVAGAMSMAAGEYVSVLSQREMYEHQIAEEREELGIPVARAQVPELRARRALRLGGQRALFRQAKHQEARHRPPGERARVACRAHRREMVE